MDEAELANVVGQVATLVEARYVFPDLAKTIAAVLAEGLAAGRYPAEAPALAAAVTADLQSVNGDKHLRLRYHEEALAPRSPDDDAEEYAAMARWADQTSGGVACVQHQDGNVGYLDLQPVLFPTAMYGQNITAAMTLLASTDALIIDLRHCLGGDPSTVTFIASYLFDDEPVQLSTFHERKDNLVKQAWTLAYVPGPRFGKTKPVYVLTSATTFSGGEQLSYDLQQLGRATVIGERTGGGAHPREGFTVHPHLEVTISVAESVSPVTGGNWEGTGVVPDVETSADQARDAASRLALQAVGQALGQAGGQAGETAGQAGEPG
jgi:C-terminal processing protease CtpA/Prc